MSPSTKPSPGSAIAVQLAKLKWLSKVLVDPRAYDIVDSAILQDAAKLDSTLSTVCYFSLFVSELILKKPQLAKLLPVLGKFGSRMAKLSPSERTVAEKLKLVSSYISDVRIFNRMWAAVPLVSWLLSTYYKIAKTGAKEYRNTDKLLDFVQVTSCLLLQVFENVGFVGDHHFTTQSDATSLWFNIWCCKLWALYVVSDIVKVLRADKLDRTALVGNLANLPLTVHWSMPEGCLSPLAVGFCGTFSSCLGTLHAWREAVDQIRAIKY